MSYKNKSYVVVDVDYDLGKAVVKSVDGEETFVMDDRDVELGDRIEWDEIPHHCDEHGEIDPLYDGEEDELYCPFC